MSARSFMVKMMRKIKCDGNAKKAKTVDICDSTLCAPGASEIEIN